MRYSRLVVPSVLEISTEGVGCLFSCSNRREPISDSDVTHRPRAALRSTIFYRKQDRLRLARLLSQYRAQTQDGADLLLQSGMPWDPSLVLDSHTNDTATPVPPSLTPQTIFDDRRVLNLFQEQCDNCKEASYDRGRRR